MADRSPRDVRPAEILRERWLVHGLASTTVTDAPVLDLGVQDTGADGATWALSNRGMTVPRDGAHEAGLALVWTLRGAPHLYRRRDLARVAASTAPFDPTDAAKRIYDAAAPLKAAGLDIRHALRTVAEVMREIVTEPMPKGAVSTEVSARLPAPFLRYCQGCRATHVYEMPFRLSALQAGLELEPGTSPPVLHPIPDWRFDPYPDAVEPGTDPTDVVSGFRRFFPHAEVGHAAAFLDAPRATIAARWGDPPTPPAVEVADPGTVRLLGPFDPFLQLKDREILVADPATRRRVWPTLGRPGVVARGGTALALWRPRASGSSFSILLEEFDPLPKRVRAAVEAEGERLARHRGRSFGGLV